MNSYIKLGIVAIMPVLFSAVLYILDQSSRSARTDARVKQTVWGVIFGLLAVLGTEWSIPLEGAVLNCRDAAVLTAGLFFGAPAGIIAGLIGGAERWLAAAWGAGYYTRLACSVSTAFAGIYAALLRKYMFEDKNPGWLLSAAVGTVMEVIHLTMVFLTNMASPNESVTIIRVCAVPMITANALSVMLSSAVVSLLAEQRIRFASEKKEQATVSQTVQRWMLVAVMIAFAATSYFVFGLQDQLASVQGDKLLIMGLDETEADIRDASDANLLSIARRLADEIERGSEELSSVAEKYGVAEINIVNADGVIVKSTYEHFIGFDMRSGDQSKEFLCLLEGRESYVQDYGPISYDPSLSRKYGGVRFGPGFLQVGYDAAQLQRDIDQDIIGITKNRHVGETGFILIVDEQFDVISAPEELGMLTVRDAVDDFAAHGPDVTLKTVLNGQTCLTRYRSAEGYHIVSVLPEREALYMRNVALYVNTFMEVIVFAVLFGLIYLLIKHAVVDQIQSINTALSRITGGNLNEAVDVRTSAEFSALSDDINSTVDTLKGYIAEASGRIDRELQLARDIQRSALPCVFPAFPKRKDIDIFASMDPAKEVGGDFYDLYMTESDMLSLLVADVSGKGIPAAMFMMRAKTELKSLTGSELGLEEVFSRGNTSLCNGNDAGMFVTAWQGKVDLETGLVRYVNAGHNPPLIRHGNGEFDYLQSRPGFVLGGMEGIRFSLQEVQLAPGDILFLYTDGVTEATNDAQELYGNDRLRNALNRAVFKNMQELCSYIREDLDSFVGGASQFDDITMMAFRYVGNPPVPSIRLEHARIEDLSAVTQFAEQEMERIGCPMKTVMQVNVAIDEIFSNIVLHGYAGRQGPVTVQITEQDEPHSLSVRFLDEGIPYNPLTAAAPDISLSAEERGIGGLGILVVKNTMDDVKYVYENGQNVLTIQKRL